MGKKQKSQKFTLECLLRGKGPHQAYRVPTPCVYACEQFQKYDITNGVRVIPERMPCPHGGYCSGSLVLLDGDPITTIDLGKYKEYRFNLKHIDMAKRVIGEVRFLDTSCLTLPASTWTSKYFAKSTCDFGLYNNCFGALHMLDSECPIIQKLKKANAKITVVPHIDDSYDVFVPNGDSKEFSSYLAMCHKCMRHLKEKQK